MGHSSLGREGKNHARRVLRGLNAKANPFDKKGEDVEVLQTKSSLAVPLLGERHATSIIDCGANLLSRQLQRDQSRMFDRAWGDHVDAVIAYTSDFDRVEELMTLVKQYPGRIYSALGLGPDNVKKTFNEKWVSGKISELRKWALSSQCVALWAGLDAVTRDQSSQFAQDRTLELHLALAADIKLPILLTEAAAAERMAEALTTWREGCATSAAARSESSAAASAEGSTAATAPTVADDGTDSLGRPYVPRAGIFGFDGTAEDLSRYIDAGAYIILTGLVCDPGETGQRLRALVHRIPLSRLLLASNSPLATPQTIPDAFIRDMRNEPSNMPAVLPVLVEAYNTALASGDASWVPVGTAPAPLNLADLAQHMYANSVAFFGFPGAEASAAYAASSAASAAALRECGEEEGDESSDDGKKEDEEEEEEKEAEESIRGSEGKEDIDAGASTAGGDVNVTGLIYHCRLCRAELFSDGDVQAHDGSGLRQSSKGVAAGAVGPVHSGVDKDSKKGGGGAAVEADEVAVGRWRETKGRVVKGLGGEGLCRMLMVDRQPWMFIPAREPEGSLLCPGPGCGAKLGQYNLAGLKCSCGLHVTPAFKIPKARVDAAVQGADAIEVLAAIEARLGERGAGGPSAGPGSLSLLGLSLAGDEDEGEGDEDGDVRRRERKKKGVVSKHRGNFSEFRNKST